MLILRLESKRYGVNLIMSSFEGNETFANVTLMFEEIIQKLLT